MLDHRFPGDSKTAQDLHAAIGDPKQGLGDGDLRSTGVDAASVAHSGEGAMPVDEVVLDGEALVKVPSVAKSKRPVLRL